MEQKKKPLRIPNRDRKGRFAENMAVFSSEEMEKAVQEYKAKTENPGAGQNFSLEK